MNQSLIAETPKNMTVDFYDEKLLIIEKTDIPYIAMKPIVEGMGLNWKTQYRKITGTKRYGHMTIPLETPGGFQEMLCIPMKKLNGWLFSINPGKVKSEIKKTVELYQEECFTVLYDYWHKGITVNPRLIQQKSETLKYIASEFEAAEILAKKFGLQGFQALLAANTAVKKLTGQDAMKLLCINLTCEVQEQKYVATEIAIIISEKMEKKISCRKVNEKLEEEGFQESYRDHKNRKKWKLLSKAQQKGKEFGEYESIGKKYSDGTPILQIKWFEKIISYLLENQCFA